ncbi:MAG: hypothetical protein K2O03_10385 [Lachnospiraceae bacterium]|nr:hypothetical protein [Lachnospiraceae bacterium]
MSTLEKAINLLQAMPENKIEAVYMYIRYVNDQTDEPPIPEGKSANSIAGIAHEYANPALIEQEEGAFERAMAEKHAIN